jgi:hypothetical protein
MRTWPATPGLAANGLMCYNTHTVGVVAAFGHRLGLGKSREAFAYPECHVQRKLSIR